jgi:hypothetical protein
VFFFFKWTFIALVVCFMFYIGSVFFNLAPEELAKVKSSFITTLDSKEIKELTTAVFEPVKRDWSDKKALIIKKVREKLYQNENNKIKQPDF